ncbi:MAG: recombination-associated protein RdgC [Arenimonas sp. SCN 70-307]|uniref:recombination-associated protein RdgC n=1 Tax=Arenimonas sp. SCN 70-307 TaxID=1660089 RepID=UPI00086E47E0|nr:recombination-associated protein RdgC [Arenimonas sp. SCN 70-307]ODS63599.1 MAG: recombination-associated protein RdgC [Arenimonas sp. SCN 70-307]
MFFRNLTFFRFPTSLGKTLDDLDARLEECRLKPVGPSELMSRGFIPPMGRDAQLMSHRIGDAIWVTLGGEDRLLPSAVVNDQLGRKLAEIEEKEGRRLGGRARKRLKEDVVMELLPRAFVRPVRCSATLDLEHGFIAVDTSSRKTAENLVSELRHALGSFPALPLNAETSVRALMTGWLAGEPLPGGLSLGDECELKDPVDGGGVVRCSRHELQAEEIRRHLEAGKQATRLALVLDDHVGFVLGEDLVIRKLKFLDGAVDQLEGTETDGVHAELDARYALMAGELKRLFAVLDGALKFSAADA